MLFCQYKANEAYVNTLKDTFLLIGREREEQNLVGRFYK